MSVSEQHEVNNHFQGERILTPEQHARYWNTVYREQNLTLKVNPNAVQSSDPEEEQPQSESETENEYVRYDERFRERPELIPQHN